MPIQPAGLLILRHQSVQRVRHVRSHVVIPVLVEAERAARVLDEEIQEADFVRGDFGEGGRDVVGYEVGTA